MDKNLEDMKKRKKTMDMMLELICKVTNDKSVLFYRETNKLQDKLFNLSIAKLKDEQYEKLINITEQYNDIVDDFIKEENIKIEEK